MSMTAPVMQQELDKALYQVIFVMPQKFKLEELPKPNNNSVYVEQYPESKFLVTQFSGGWSEKKWANRAKKLIEHARKNKFKILSTPIYARYDSPWTDSSLRRNEIMVAVE